MIENIPNPLADAGIKREIDEKVNELLSEHYNPYNNGICDYIRCLVKISAEWGMVRGFRMGWKVYEATEGGKQ